MKLISDTIKHRPLPWCVQEPYDGCEPGHMQYSVWDADGNLVCECDGEDEGRAEAIAICAAVNLSGPRECKHCGKEATCFGAYENGLDPAYACSDCCGHGCEDGYCEPLEDPNA